MPNQISSLVAPLRELRDRISLEVPDTFIQEESIRESADQQSASLLIVWYEREDNTPGGEFLAVGDIIDRLTKEVLSDKPVSVESHEERKKEGVTQTLIQVFWDETKRTASFEVPLPEMSLDVCGSLYEAVDGGGGYVLLKDGEVLEEDLPTLPFVLGTLVTYVLPDLAAKCESRSNADAQVDIDFLESVGDYLAESPMVLDDSIGDHLIEFIELVTNREME